MSLLFFVSPCFIYHLLLTHTHTHTHTPHTTAKVEEFLRAKPLDIKKIPPFELARQVTLIQHEMLRRIKPTELLSRKWDNAMHAPNVFIFVAFANRLSAWMLTTILKEEKVDDRAAMISYFISVALVCVLFFLLSSF